MHTAKKDLNLLLVEVNDISNEIEKDIVLFTTHQKDKTGIDYYKGAVELRTQLLRSYELKADLLKTLYHI